MEQIINYRDIPTDKRIDILNALERIGFFPAYGGVRTMQQIMEKSVPGSGPQFYFVFRENELIGYNFLIGDTKKYKAFPWLAISNMDEQKLTVCEELMKMNADQICVMDHGKLVATGRHQELIQSCPEYQKLWKAAQDSAEWKVHTAKEGK